MDDRPISSDTLCSVLNVQLEAFVSLTVIGRPVSDFNIIQFKYRTVHFQRPIAYKDPHFSNFIFLFRINAPRGYGIRLTWREFHIDGCARSAIYIFDGKETDGIEPDRYCGKQKPRDWSSTGMFIIKLVDTGGKAGN